MPICTASKATSAMRATGTDRPAGLRRRDERRANGIVSWRRCWPRPPSNDRHLHITIGTAMNAPVKKSKLIKGATGDWEVVIGLEVHAQVTSQSKLFSGASTAFGGAPNSHVSLVDAAMPGMLPVIKIGRAH